MMTYRVTATYRKGQWYISGDVPSCAIDAFDEYVPDSANVRAYVVNKLVNTARPCIVVVTFKHSETFTLA